MPFSYYRRLSPQEKAVYRQSDAVAEVRLPRPEAARPLALELGRVLASDRRLEVERASHALVAALLAQLGVGPVTVKVQAVRPRRSRSELHGLYERAPGMRPVITLWMRTAAQARVVAFRTYLRTLLHEVGHHLDYEHLGLPVSFHTQGFFRRESAFVRQLLARGRKSAAEAGAAAPAARRPFELELKGRVAEVLEKVRAGGGGKPPPAPVPAPRPEPSPRREPTPRPGPAAGRKPPPGRPQLDLPFGV